MLHPENSVFVANGQILQWKLPSFSNNHAYWDVTIQFALMLLRDQSYGIAIGSASHIPQVIDIYGSIASFHGLCVWKPGDRVYVVQNCQSETLFRVVSATVAEAHIQCYVKPIEFSMQIPVFPQEMKVAS